MEAYSQKIGPGHPEPVVATLDPAHVDRNGTITNVCLEPCGSVAVIECGPGTVRSNHLHKTDWHYLYVVSGRMVYRCRQPGGEERRVNVFAGECVFTPPGLEHRCEFAVPTTLVSCSKLPRDHETHEADLVRVEW